MARVNKIILIGIGLALFFGFGFVMPANASGASLYLSPNRGTFYIGSTFDVSIFVNTAGNSINAVKADLQFDPRKLQLVNPTGGKSFISVWVAFPSYSNTDGTLTFQGGMPTPGIKTSAGLVSTVTFRAIAQGETKIQFINSSQVLLDDGNGTNVLDSLNAGSYLISVLPPEGPKISSSTHFDSNKWRKNNNPTFSWEKEKGVAGFSYSIDLDPEGVPDSVSEGNLTSVSYAGLKDGIWYFHIKAEKQGAWGGTSHYVALIDTTPPASFALKVDPSEKTSVSQPVVSFVATDTLSGMDHFEIKVIDLTPERNKTDGSFFIEASSPYQLPHLDVGKYMIAARAFDKAGNWRDEVVKIEIIPQGTAIRRDGLWVYGFYFSWWIIVLIILISAVSIFLRIIYRWKKGKNENRESLENLKIKERELNEQIKKLEN